MMLMRNPLRGGLDVVWISGLRSHETVEAAKEREVTVPNEMTGLVDVTVHCLLPGRPPPPWFSVLSGPRSDGVVSDVPTQCRNNGVSVVV